MTTTDGKTIAGEAAIRSLATPDRLRSFFSPRSVALVGGSEDSGWSRFVVESLGTAGLPGPIVPVHPRRKVAFGKPTVPTLRDLSEQVDLAFVLAPTRAVEGVLDDAAAAGVRNLVVLASGYGEGGEQGQQLQDRLVQQAVERDLTILGPNCLGYINAHARSAPFGLHIVPPLVPGPVGVVLQSGALASAVLQFARSHGIGISLLASMGNEAVITTADVVEYLVTDDETRVIALFLESIRQAGRFTQLAGRALDAGKPMVVLKVGRSAHGQRAALAHTGAIAGDDAVVDAALRQFGVVRVNSLEELLVTAGLFGYTPRLPAGPRMGVVTASGGACDIIADRCEDEGIELPDFSAETTATLAAALPPFASARNPLDITGFGLADPQAAQRNTASSALGVVTADPNVDFVVNVLLLPDSRPPDPAPAESRIAGVAAAAAASPVPVIQVSTTCNDVSDYTRGLLDRHGLHVLGGIEFGMTAMGHALRWSTARQRRAEAAARPAPQLSAPNGTAPTGTAAGGTAGPWSEARSREFVAAHGLPVVPAELVTDADAAVAAADRLGYPVVLKICSAAVTHKSDIGGVALGLASADEVRAAYRRVGAAGAAAGAEVEGVLVSPMRPGGLELFAGITVDPSFGPVLAVGLGGVFLEVLRDTSLRVLPTDADDVRRMLGELRAAPLLHGARGSTPADLDAVAGAVLALAESARALGPSLQAIEVNPLRVDGSTVEALDVLVVTAA